MKYSVILLMVLLSQQVFPQPVWKKLDLPSLFIQGVVPYGNSKYLAYTFDNFYQTKNEGYEWDELTELNAKLNSSLFSVIANSNTGEIYFTDECCINYSSNLVDITDQYQELSGAYQICFLNESIILSAGSGGVLKWTSFNSHADTLHTAFSNTTDNIINQNGYVYVSTIFEGILIADTSGLQFTRISGLPDRPSPVIPRQTLSSVYMAAAFDSIFNTGTVYSVYRFDTDGSNPVKIASGSGFIGSLLIDNEENLYIASNDTLFWIYNLNNNQSRLIPRGSAGFSNINSVFLTENGKIWISTDDGLFELNDSYLNSNNFHDNSFEVSFLENYPNPFNGTTWIEYSISTRENVSIEIITASGSTIFRDYFKEQDPGYHTLNINTSEWAPGIYICRLSAGIKYGSSRMSKY